MTRPTSLYFQAAAALAAALALLPASHASATTAEAPSGSFVVGAGVSTSPRYSGSAQRHTAPALLLDAHFANGFFIGSEGIGFQLSADPKHTFGVAMSGDGGREDRNRRFTEGSDELKGMGKLHATGYFGAFAGTELGPVSLLANLRRGVTGKGHRGTTLAVTASMPLWQNDKTKLEAGVGAEFGDRKFLQAWHGVTPEQSARSGFRVFTPKAGLRGVSFNLSLQHSLTENVFVQASLGVSRLTGDAANSPITFRKTQPTAGVMLGYRF